MQRLKHCEFYSVILKVDSQYWFPIILGLLSKEYKHINIIYWNLSNITISTQQLAYGMSFQHNAIYP